MVVRRYGVAAAVAKYDDLSTHVPTTDIRREWPHLTRYDAPARSIQAGMLL
jgi:hypothetical protein